MDAVWRNTGCQIACLLIALAGMFLASAAHSTALPSVDRDFQAKSATGPRGISVGSYQNDSVYGAVLAQLDGRDSPRCVGSEAAENFLLA